MSTLPKNVSDFLFRSAQFMADFDRDTHGQHLWTACDDGTFESPIEQLLWIALRSVAHTNFIDLKWPQNGFDEAAGYYLFPQFSVGQYRLDFAILEFIEAPHSPGDEPKNKLAIECDGHDFHERTKVQASWDKQRDRWLTAHGWKILRYTGSDIVRDPYQSAVEILRLVVGGERGWTITSPAEVFPE